MKKSGNKRLILCEICKSIPHVERRENGQLRIYCDNCGIDVIGKNDKEAVENWDKAQEFFATMKAFNTLTR